MSAFATTAVLVDAPILMDPFCLKQFQPAEAGGQHIPIPCTPDEFIAITNRFYAAQPVLSEGYAPFCKHLFIPASAFPFPPVPCAYAEITEANKGQLESTYSARTEKELPVLTRFFAKGSVTPATATYLDVILYSRAQIEKENAAMSSKPVVDASAASDRAALSDAFNSHKVNAAATWTWGIVSIKPQNVDHETPMNPITIMRNSLGVEEGGSGVALDRAAYLASVAFWQRHALVQ